MWSELNSGLIVDYNNPERTTVVFQDIAWALSRMGRFNGHTHGQYIYSIAQHSVWVAKKIQRHTVNCSKNLVMHALLHDAHQAFLGSSLAFIKCHPTLSDMAEKLEQRIKTAISKQYQLSKLQIAEKISLDLWDSTAITYEAFHLMASKASNYNSFPLSDDLKAEKIKLLPPKQALDEFWMAFEYIKAGYSLREMDCQAEAEQCN